MKAKKIAVAVALAGTMGANQVLAHGPTVTPDIEMWVSGASAQDNALGLLFTDMCLPGTLDTYLDDNVASPGKAHRAFFCTIDSTKVSGLTQGTGANPAEPTVLFHKRSAGGSGMGVQPVADEVAMAHMVISNTNCSDIGGNTWHCSIDQPGETVDIVSDAGISDVEPALFVPPNVPAGASPVTPEQIAKMDITSQTAVVFGIPVTTNLRNALQEAQGLSVGLDDEENMPSLSKQQVASLFNGTITNWNELSVGGVAFPSAVTTGPSNPLVNICRRVPGSGTQAQFNAKFAHVPCTGGVAQPVESGNPFTGPVVTLNSGSGDVTTCLNNAFSANLWAVGIQSTEKNDDLADNFRFIKIDGVAPTIQNAANNTYFDWVENSIQWRKAAFNGPGGDVLTILQKIAADAGSPTNVATLNTSFVHPWGQGGYLALNTNGHTPSVPFDINNPIATASHALAGGVNNCAVPLIPGNSEL